MLSEPTPLQQEYHSAWVAARQRMYGAGIKREREERDREERERREREARRRAEDQRRREIIAEARRAETERLLAEFNEFRACTADRLPSIESITRAACAEYQVSRLDIMSSRRTAAIVRPRQVAMYLAKTLTAKNMPEIGRRFGGRDHTTVLHAVRKIGSLLPTDADLAGRVSAIKARVEAALAQD